jgi:hypothetical protein
MNLPLESIHSWEELYHQLVTNFESSFSWSDVAVDFHVVQLRLGEALHSFIKRFS